VEFFKSFWEMFEFYNNVGADTINNVLH